MLIPCYNEINSNVGRNVNDLPFNVKAEPGKEKGQKNV